MTVSAWGPPNAAFPSTYTPPIGNTNVPLQWADYKDDVSFRLNAMGSRHSGAINVAFADGSVRQRRGGAAVIRALCTRAGNESVGDY